MNFKIAVLAGFVISMALPRVAAVAQTTANSPDKQGNPTTDQSSDLTSGEIQKIDKDTGRLTIRHGEIRNLGMPAMTMVFATKDKSMADKVRTGDKIRFKAVNENGKLVVTDIAPDK